MSTAFDYYSETKTGFGFNLKPVLLNRMRPRIYQFHQCAEIVSFYTQLLLRIGPPQPTRRTSWQNSWKL